MSTAERFTPSDPGRGEGPQRGETSRRSELRPAVQRTRKRFELGFFVRKVRFGRLAYYKELLLIKKLEREAGVAPPPPPLSSEGQESKDDAAPMMMARSRSTADDDGGVSPLGGPGMGDDNPGPIGGTRYEAGFFAGTVTETTGDDDEPA